MCLQTNLPVFKLRDSGVRRRYSDFEWLRNELERDSKVTNAFVIYIIKMYLITSNRLFTCLVIIIYKWSSLCKMWRFFVFETFLIKESKLFSLLQLSYVTLTNLVMYDIQSLPLLYFAISVNKCP